MKTIMGDLLSKAESEVAAGFGELEKLAGRPLYPIHWYIAEVDPGKLYRGSWPDAKHLTGLRAMGITTAVNLCAERSQDAVVRAVGMTPFNIPIIDNTVPSNSDVMSLQAIMQVARERPVLIHCEQGQGRTGCMVAAYRVLVNGWKPEDALAEAEHFGLKLASQKDFILALHGAAETRIEG